MALLCKLLPAHFGRLLVLVLAVLLVSRMGGQSATEQVQADFLTLRELVRRVLAENESLQMQVLEMEINRQKLKGERGVFQPELVGSAEHEENKRETTIQEQISTRTPLFQEKNNIYNLGLESLLPVGTRVRLGYTLRDLRNNLDSSSIFGFTRYNPLLTNHQYVSFAGLSAVQPLLKNGGFNAAMANIRLAAMASDISFQEYRRQLMITISKSEALYWNLYLAQEQLLFFRDSVALAQTLVNDNEERLKAGKGSELEVLQAQSALALRKSKQAEAMQKYFESLNNLNLLFSESVVSTNNPVIAVDEPVVSTNAYTFADGWRIAFDYNPDYLIQRKRLLAENIRLAYAKNQRLPQLDLKASYGLNGLGGNANESMQELQTSSFPSWMVGVEARVPIGGSIRGRSEYNAAKLRRQQSLLGLKDLENQIANTLETVGHKAISTRTSAGSYQTTVDFNRNLLESELERLKVGKVESRKVLEVEEDLFEAKNALAEAKVQYQRAMIEQELVQGSLLRSRNVELTQQQLQERTRNLARYANISSDQLRKLMGQLQLDYMQKGRSMDGSAENDALQMLHDQMPPPAPLPMPSRPMTEEELEKARQTLNDSLENYKPTKRE